jgi:hypothetical protein
LSKLDPWNTIFALMRRQRVARGLLPSTDLHWPPILIGHYSPGKIFAYDHLCCRSHFHVVPH